MSRFATCLALSLCWAPVPSGAQALWQWLHPTPQGNDLHAVAILDANTAVAVGAAGTVLETRDRGATWQLLPNVSGAPDLRGVCAAGEDAIVAVGGGGTILRSRDRGRTWTRQTSGTSAALLDVDCAGANHGTAVGGGGTILRTTDGGITWHAQSSGTTAWLEGVSLVDADVGYAVGSPGTILKTVDGGQTWKPQESGTTWPLYDVDFADTENGIAVGTRPNESGWFRGPLALGTTDGGATWSPLAVPPPIPPIDEALRAVFMPDAMHALAVGTYVDNWWGGEEGLLLRTADGGLSWSGGRIANNLDDVAMFSETEGVIVGAAGYIGRIQPDGVVQVGGASQNFAMRCVDYYDEDRGVALAAETAAATPVVSSRSFATKDGGKTWSTGYLGWADMSDVAFADSTTVYAVGHGPRHMDSGAAVLRSQDGGITWEWFASWACNPSARLCIPDFWAVDFAGPEAGVAVGVGSALSILGGVAVAWTVLDSTGALVFSDVSVPSERTAWAVGSRASEGVLFVGSPASGSWTELPNPKGVPWPHFSGVSFTDDSTGTVVAYDGTMLRTKDGGRSWEEQFPPSGDLAAVSFLDARNGIALSGTSTLLKTVNGGSTWVPEDIPAVAVDIVYVDPRNVVAVGGSQNIIGRLDVAVPVLLQAAAFVHPEAVELLWTTPAGAVLDGFRVNRTERVPGSADVRTSVVGAAERAYWDAAVTPGATYEYVVSALAGGRIAASSPPMQVVLAPPALALRNHPNPFNPTTRVHFVLPVRAHVLLSVHDVAGRRITTLVDGVLQRGAHAVTWDGRNAAGEPVVSGIYFCRLRTPQSTLVRKMTVLR